MSDKIWAMKNQNPPDFLETWANTAEARVSISLRDRRKKNGLTLEEASDELGIDKGNLSRIERGKQRPSWSTAIAIADLYGISLDAVFGRTPRG